MEIQNSFITLGWVLCVSLSAWAVGRILLRFLLRTASQALTPGLDVIFSVALGYIALAFAAFALGALQLLFSVVIILAILAGTFIGIVVLR
jgi:hypothetical protein